MRPWYAALGAALVGAMAVPAAAQPTPPAPAATPQVTCEFYEISASMEKTSAVDSSLPQPLQKKVSKGAFKQWNTYKMQSHVSKTLVKKKAEKFPLKDGGASAELVELVDKTKVRLTMSVEDGKGKTLVEQKSVIDAGDWLIVVVVAANDTGHLLAGTCK
jgi:hypothetical protein